MSYAGGPCIVAAADASCGLNGLALYQSAHQHFTPLTISTTARGLCRRISSAASAGLPNVASCTLTCGWWLDGKKRGVVMNHEKDFLRKT